MKKIIISAFIVLAAVLVSCYDPTQEAKVRINLGNIPLDRNVQVSFLDRLIGLFSTNAYASNAEYYVQKLHIAAVSGDTVLSSASIDAADVEDDVTGEGSFVELNVPAGDDISIVVVGEYNLEGTYVNYYGYETTDLNAGSSTTLQIQVNPVSSTLIGFNRQNNILPYYIYWNKIPGAVITVTDDSGGQVYKGTGTRAYVDESQIGNTFYVTAEFGFAGISTQTYDFGW